MIGQSNGQLRAFIDRVLRLKGEQDTITDDIKEVYAEAKASGFDKTMMGKLVAHLRKVEKAGGVQKLNEEDALFDLYLKSYLQAGTDHADNTTHVHAHEAVPRVMVEQAPRPAGLSEIRQAYKSGQPISQDFKFENGSVYFAHFPALGRLKIGISNDVKSRLQDLTDGCGDEAVLIGTIAGNRKSEMAAHKAFKAWHIAGEWFSADDECLGAAHKYIGASASVLWADPAISEHITTELRSPPSVEIGKSAGADEIAVPSAPVLTEHDPETGEIVETPDERLSSSGQDGEAVPPNPAALTPETGGGACPGPASEQPHGYSQTPIDVTGAAGIDLTLPSFLRRAPIAGASA
jgi:uncharacterized protein (UPF0335 family)